jgi:hypothetical protein
VKARTTAVNDVAVARSGNANSKSKKPTKNLKAQVIEISDPEDDDSLERGAALASPAKGSESRKATNVSKFYISSPYYVFKNIVIRARSSR